MPEYLAPGVYVEEVPRGPAPIAWADTAVTALLGHARRGPRDEPVAVTSLAEYDARFGRGPLRRALRDFVDNGGRSAYVVRVGDPAAALAALGGVDFQLLVAQPGLVDRASAYAVCRERRAFLVTEPDVLDAVPGGDPMPEGLGRDAAVYAPGLAGRDGARSPAAAVAGVFARTDRDRGVWKAPAGLEATVVAPHGLAAAPTDSDGDRLNPLHVNLVRGFRGSAPVVWGARTADRDDAEWKYVPVRRTFLMVGRSLEAGLQWAVFEPNAEPLWARLRAEVEGFCSGLWRQGGLQGSQPREAYVVRCDRTTMTQADIDAGLAIVVVGLALTRPGEFHVLRLGLPTLSA